MKIKEIINAFDVLKPNQYDPEQKIKWISDLDGFIYNNVLTNHSGTYPEWKPYTNDEEEVLVEEPYTEVYIHLLSYKVDYFNREFEEYNYSAVKYNEALAAYRNHYNKTHLPLQKNKLSWE